MPTEVRILLLPPTEPTDRPLTHGYIENDFDVHDWAAPGFREKAGVELLDEEWKRSMARLPEATELEQAMAPRLG